MNCHPQLPALFRGTSLVALVFACALGGVYADRDEPYINWPVMPDLQTSGTARAPGTSISTGAAAAPSTTGSGTATGSSTAVSGSGSAGSVAAGVSGSGSSNSPAGASATHASAGSAHNTHPHTASTTDCWTSMWGEWQACPVTCGGGERIRTRTVTRPAQKDGSPCGSLADRSDCGQHMCPQDCEVSEWTQWSECTAKCGSGTKTRHRSITRHPAGGVLCPALSVEAACNEHQCCAQGSIGCVADPNSKEAVTHTALVSHLSPHARSTHMDARPAALGSFVERTEGEASDSPDAEADMPKPSEDAGGDDTESSQKQSEAAANERLEYEHARVMRTKLETARTQEEHWNSAVSRQSDLVQSELRSAQEQLGALARATAQAEGALHQATVAAPTGPPDSLLETSHLHDDNIDSSALYAERERVALDTRKEAAARRSSRNEENKAMADMGHLVDLGTEAGALMDKAAQEDRQLQLEGDNAEGASLLQEHSHQASDDETPDDGTGADASGGLVNGVDFSGGDSVAQADLGMGMGDGAQPTQTWLEEQRQKEAAQRQQIIALEEQEGLAEKRETDKELRVEGQMETATREVSQVESSMTSARDSLKHSNTVVAGRGGEEDEESFLQDAPDHMAVESMARVVHADKSARAQAQRVEAAEEGRATTDMLEVVRDGGQVLQGLQDAGDHEASALPGPANLPQQGVALLEVETKGPKTLSFIERRVAHTSGQLVRKQGSSVAAVIDDSGVVATTVVGA